MHSTEVGNVAPIQVNFHTLYPFPLTKIPTIHLQLTSRDCIGGMWNGKFQIREVGK